MTDPTINDLIRQATGPKPELALPEMQRRYVWRSGQVKDLFDSLYREYPIGSFLIWERPLADFEGRSLDVGEGAGKIDYGARMLLLDGQQRLTSLKSIINDEDLKTKDGKTRSIDILFNVTHPDFDVVDGLDNDYEEKDDDDLDGAQEDDALQFENKTFVVSNKRLLNKQNWVSLRRLFRDGVTRTWKDVIKGMGLSWDADEKKTDEIHERLEKLHGIVNRPVSIVTLRSNLNYQTVTDIFCRVNSAGTRLRGSDLAIAQITSRRKGMMAVFEEFCDNHKCNKQRLFDMGMVVRAFVVFMTGQCKFQTIASIPVDKYDEGWKYTKEALETAVSIVNGWGISSFTLLSAPALIITLAYYIKRRPNEVGNLSLLHKWLLVASICGHYSKGSSETIMDQDLSAIDRGEPIEQLIKSLDKQGWHGRIVEDDLKGKLHGSPYFSLMYLAMRSNGAKDWNYDSVINLVNVGSSLKIQFHHIFPKACLKDTPYEDKEKNDICNLAFIGGKSNNGISDSLPEEYLPKIRDEDLRAQCVPLDRSLYPITKFREFLAERRKLLVGMLNKYLDQL